MRAKAFLAQWELTFEDLLKHVRPLEAGETMWLVGSIADDLATSLSDINMLIVGDSGLDATLVFGESGFERSIVRLPQGCRIKIEYWRGEDAEHLRRRLSAVLIALYDPSTLHQMDVFSDVDLRFLHRIRTGLPLANDGRAEHWRRELRVDSLPDYLLLHWLTAHHALREDAWGQAKEGDLLSGWWMARAALDYLGAALLAWVGETNPYPKWRLRLLQRNRAAVGPETVDAIVSLLFPDTASDLFAHLRRINQFSDEVLERRLATSVDDRATTRAVSDKVRFLTSTLRPTAAGNP